MSDDLVTIDRTRLRIFILGSNAETARLDRGEAARLDRGEAARLDRGEAPTLTAAASLIRSPDNAAARINRIDEDVLRRRAPLPEVAWRRIAELVEESEIVIAHGVNFDRRFIPTGHPALDIPWLCSLEDMEWPYANRPNDNLVGLALSHGLGVATAHRALADVDLLARLLARVAEQGFDLDAILRRGLRPRSVYQALVPFARKDEAKLAGFFWEGSTKRWLRSLADEDAGIFSFEVARVQKVDRGPRPGPELLAPRVVVAEGGAPC